MLNKLMLAGAAFAMGATALVPAAPAMALDRDGYYGRGYYDRDWRDDRRDWREDRRDWRRDRRADRRYYRNNYRCRDEGTGGLVVGAIAGGLLGNEVAGRGDRAVGTILGGAVGALAGRAIDRSDRPRGCR